MKVQQVPLTAAQNMVQILLPQWFVNTFLTKYAHLYITNLAVIPTTNTYQLMVRSECCMAIIARGWDQGSIQHSCFIRTETTPSCNNYYTARAYTDR